MQTVFTSPDSDIKGIKKPPLPLSRGKLKIIKLH